MRDRGLQQAIDAAGGVGQLARALGIAQPSVSNWARVPAERVLAVESATGVRRSALRPDLYPEPDASSAAVDEVDAARASCHRLVGSLLRRAPDEATLRRLAALKGDGTTIGMAMIELADAAAATTAEAASHEYFALFIGVGRSEVLPYASYYLTGFLHERPLARVREDMARLGVARAEGDFEPEDHLGTLLDVMAGLAGGAFAASEAEQARFFARHVAPWAARFFADLEAAESARFYRAVARLGRRFMDIETEAFAIAA